MCVPELESGSGCKIQGWMSCRGPFSAFLPVIFACRFFVLQLAPGVIRKIIQGDNVEDAPHQLQECW